MPENTGFSRTPLVLVVESSETSVRLVERMLTSNGYAVLKAYSGRQADRLLERVRPDIVLVGTALPDIEGVEYLARVRARGLIRRSTPALLITSQAESGPARATAYEAGAWGVLGFPPSEAELVPLLRSFVRAKQESDTAREESLVDLDTGLYNVRGILKRVAEVTADATRHGRPIACVALGLERPKEDNEARAMSEEFAAQLAAAIRGSDTVGRLADTDFVVLAPGTDLEGASRMAERLLAHVEPRSVVGNGGPSRRVRVGYATLSGPANGVSFVPVDLLTQATLALRKAQEQPDSEPICVYEA